MLDVIKGLSTVSELDRLKLLYSTFGDGTGTMNLELDRFPERYRSNISTTLKFLKFDYAVTHEEATVLTRVSHCSNDTRLKKLKAGLFAMNEEDVTSGVESEVNASVVNEYSMINRETTQCKLEFKLIDLNGRNADVLLSEGKPSACPPKAIWGTEEKNRKIRVLNINTIARRLRHPSLIQHFEALAALWQGSKGEIEKERVLLTPKKVETLNCEVFQLAVMDDLRPHLRLVAGMILTRLMGRQYGILLQNCLSPNISRIWAKQWMICRMDQT
ncbi:hypothetical protein BJV82DRAFT_573983 [Fennellomyces sp. T-0311]|nr:hypothetical protein BJV82DRAFT_573983 [Fennellomyces sp. T-0311]